MALSPDSPYARAFAADGGTLQALRAGLAGRKAKVQRGRLAAALRSLAGEPASRVLFVDLDGVSEPGRAARELASVCAFETAVIAIGSTDTAQYTRELFQHGIADYLVKPISASLVREACAAVTDEAAERPYAGRVIAFAGQRRKRDLHPRRRALPRHRRGRSHGVRGRSRPGRRTAAGAAGGRAGRGSSRFVCRSPFPVSERGRCGRRSRPDGGRSLLQPPNPECR